MNAARRNLRRRDWPRGLYEPRPGYYVWRHPNGKTYPLGRVSFAVARGEAIAANVHISETAPSLVQRLSGAGQTMADLLLEMPAAKAANTAKSWRSLDGKIKAAMGSQACGSLTTADCAKLIEGEVKAGKARSAEALRSRLLAVCQRGQELGWMTGNPAEPTKRPEVKVQRGRLTLDTFRAIYAQAGAVAEWLPHAMMLALVTGADRVTIAGLQRSDMADGYLTISRSKTGARVAIPTAIRLDCVGVSLADLLAVRTGVVSRYLVHHVNVWGNAPAGSSVHPDTISRAFTAARVKAKIPDEAAPTFHELRSLAKRLYDEQGNVDTKALLGHATAKMAAMYADPRGVEPIKVRVGVK